MKLRIRLLALSTLLLTFNNFNFPTLAANSPILPKCSSTPTFREEFTKSKQTELPDQYAFNIIIHRLIGVALPKIRTYDPSEAKRRKNLEQLSQLLNQSILVANTIDNPRYKAEALTLIAASYSAAIEPLKAAYLEVMGNYPRLFEDESLKLLNQSLDLVNSIKQNEEKIKILARIATIYANLEKPEQISQTLTQALKIINKMEDVNQRSRALHKVVEYYLDPARILQLPSLSMMPYLSSFQEKPEQRINRLNTALQIANQIEITDYKFNVLAKIANEYSRLKQYDRTLQIVRNIQDNSLKGEVLAQIIQSSAWNTISQERTAAQNPRIARIETQSQVYNELEILTKIFEIINAVKDANSKDILLGELACGYIDASANIASYIEQYNNKLSIAFADASYLIDQALLITNNIRNSEIKSKTLALIAFKISNLSSSVLKTHIAYRQFEASRQLAKLLRNRSLKIAHTIPNNEIKFKTFGVIAFNIFKTSRELLRHITIFNQKPVKQLYWEAFVIINEITNKDIKSEILGEIAVDFTTGFYYDSVQKKYSQALQIANIIEISSAKNKALSELAENYVTEIRVQKQNAEEKDKYLELLPQVLQIAKNPIYEPALRPMIANLYLEVGESDRAFQLINSLSNPEIRFNLLAKVATQYAIAGKTQKANSIFAEILLFAKTKNNLYQKASALHTIATAFRDSKRYEEASQIITQASLIIKNVQYSPPLKQTRRIDNRIFPIFYPKHENSLSKNQDNRISLDYISLNDLMFRIDRFIFELNMGGKYRPQSSFNHNLRSLIAESKYEEALELVQQSRSRVLVDLINRPSSLLSYTPEYFEQLKAHPTPPPPKIDQIRKIAKQRQATLVEYTIVYQDNQNQDVTQNPESELFIWVVKPTGEVAFRRVNLTFFKQQNIWLAQLASNPQLFIRGLMQELKVNTQKVNPAFIAMIILSVGSVICISLRYLRLLFYSRVEFQQVGTTKKKKIPKKEVNFLYSYTSDKNLLFQKFWRRWLLLMLVLAGGSGVFMFGNISRQQIVANRHQGATISRDTLPLNKNQNQPKNNQADNSLLANLVADSRESMGVRGRGLGLVPKIEKSKQTNRLQQLHQLLIEPISDLLPTDPNHTVVFIPTKSLFFVPFPALQDREGKYLIQKHTILTAPSIQVLDLAHQRRQKIQQSINKDVLVVGNPTMPILISADGKLPEQLPPLPGAQQEAHAIASLLNTKPLIGSDATEPVVMSRMLKARIIHIATHGLLDPIYKWRELPGAIALAPLQDNSTISLHALQVPSPPSMPNNELIDGFFMLDNYYFSVPPLNAELVVLSACDTGRGKLTEDGVVGLSRSFITAGVPSLIVSLWAIPDAPTAFLMTEFYRNWQQTGNKAQALRQAMLTTMKQHPDPRNWAAFTLIGEAK